MYRTGLDLQIRQSGGQTSCYILMAQEDNSIDCPIMIHNK